MPEPEPQRRREDPAYDAEASFIKKAMDNPLVSRAIQMLVAAALGAVAGGSTHQIADATEEKLVNANREQILAIKQDVKELREGFQQRVRVEEIEREESMQRLRDRVIYLEAKTGHSLRRRPGDLAVSTVRATP